VKVYVLPADVYGCGHYRLIWPAWVLQQAGHEVTIIPPVKGQGFGARTATDDNGNEVLIGVQIPEDADVVVIQRPAHPLQPQMINILRSNGVAVVVDMDDDMSSIHPDNSAFQMYRHRSNTPYSWKHAALSCRIATLVTVTTPRLLKVYAGHGRGLILDNYVPASYLDTLSLHTNSFGWAGTTKSHPNDPQVTAPAAQKLIDEGRMFSVVGGDRHVQGAFRMRQPPMMTGIIPMAEWPTAIGSGLDVGWAPLAATTFNSAKSRLKPLEYMSTGVAWVGSPREAYRKVQRDSGCGLLADTPKQWYEYTKQLLDDDPFREDQIAAGREYMQNQTYENNAWKWWEAWEQASQFERKRVGLDQ